MITVVHTGPLDVNTCIVELGGSSVFIVDPANSSFSGDENKLVQYLNGRKLDVVAIVLTHGHFDHVAGSSVLKKAFPSAKILIHSKDAKYIGKDSKIAQGELLSCGGFSEFLPYVLSLAEADDFMEDGKNLSDYVKCSGLEDWVIYNTPGHTKGSVCLYNEKQKILISGDTVFYHSCGRTDFPDGSDEEMKESLAFLKEKIPGETLVYPGHGYAGFEYSKNF